MCPPDLPISERKKKNHARVTPTLFSPSFTSVRDSGNEFWYSNHPRHFVKLPNHFSFVFGVFILSECMRVWGKYTETGITSLGTSFHPRNGGVNEPCR